MDQGIAFFDSVRDAGLISVPDLLKEGWVFVYDTFKFQSADFIGIKRPLRND